MSRRTHASTLLFIGLVGAMAASGCGNKDGVNTGGTGGTTSGGTGGRAGSGGSGSGGAGGAGGTAASGGQAGDAGGGDSAPVSGDYFPFAVGNSWEYDVTAMNSPTERKVHTIVRMEAVGGAGPDKNRMVYRVETQRPGGVGDATISWQAREGSKIVRYREQNCSAGSVMLANGSVASCTVNEENTWSPPRIRIDEQPTGKAYAKDLAWEETYTETKTTTNLANTPPMVTTTEVHTSRWTVVDVGVTAMNFSNCVVLRKTSVNDVPKTYTFCKGIGKVKEEGAGQTETLIKYTVK